MNDKSMISIKMWEAIFLYNQHCKAKKRRGKFLSSRKCARNMHEKHDEWDWWFNQWKPWPMTRRGVHVGQVRR